MPVQLRDYQVSMVESILSAFGEHRSVMCQMPTGTGKTEVFCAVIQAFREMYPQRNILVIVHRAELLRQIRARLRERFNIHSGALASNFEVDFRHPVQVGMVMSIQKRDERPRRSLIVIDEAHHAAAPTYKRLIDLYMADPEIKLLGVTATPARLDGKKLSDMFSCLLLSDPIGWFTKKGHLSKIKYYGIGSIPLGELTVKMGDFDENSASTLMKSDRLLAETLGSYLTFARGKKTLIFCVSLDHAGAVQETFRKEGIYSDIIDSNTIADDRIALVNRFQNRPGGVMINVGIFTEGFDCPDIDVVILARPTQSITLYLQMIGRVTRTANGKPFGTILDNAGNHFIHGLPTKQFDWRRMFENTEELTNEAFTEQTRQNVRLRARKPPIETPDLEMIELIDETDEDSYEVEGNSSEFITWSISGDLPKSLSLPFRPTNRGAYYFPNHVCDCGTYVHRFVNSRNDAQNFSSMLPEMVVHDCDNEISGKVPSCKAFPAELESNPPLIYKYNLSMLDFILPRIQPMIYGELPPGTTSGECPIIVRRMDPTNVEIDIYDLTKKEVEYRRYQADADSLDTLFSIVPDPQEPKPPRKKKSAGMDEPVGIGNQIWMSKNLSVKQFRNGHNILVAKSVEDWVNACNTACPACCFYDNDPNLDESFGMLYNWYAVNDQRVLAPVGWRIPDNEDWEILFKFIESSGGLAGRDLKKDSLWDTPRVGHWEGKDLVGFSATPGGCRSIDGTFSSIHRFGNWWTSTLAVGGKAHAVALSYDDRPVDSHQIHKGFGYSVRCLKIV